ncbi:MAG: LysR family transcriptional regulator [Thermoleophilia bacterium]|nr:LysR family transcriptional regulator [Thermoleophilia bacterium]
MDVRRLRYFVEVVDSGGFTAAAGRLHVSQPSISAQIGVLEREVGHRLLDRRARPVRPTSTGAALLAHARRAVDAMDAFAAASDSVRGLVTGDVTVATVAGGPHDWFYDAIAAFHAAHPGVRIRLSEGLSHDIARGVADARVDLAVVGSSGPTAGNAVTVADDVLVAVTAADGAPARPGPFTAAALGGERIVAMLPGTGIREATDAFLAGARGAPPPVVALEVASPAAVLRLVRAGMGVGLVASLAAAGAPGVRVHRLAPGEFRSRLDLVWSSNESPAAVALRDHVRRAVPGASP